MTSDDGVHEEGDAGDRVLKVDDVEEGRGLALLAGGEALDVEDAQLDGAGR